MRMRKSLVGVLIGFLIFLAGIGLVIALPTSAPWETKTDQIAEGEVLETGWLLDYDYYCPYFFLHIYGGETKDWTVSGTAVEAEGRSFNFYVFDKTNFDLWKGGATNTEAYVVRTSVTSVSFQFKIDDGSDVDDLYFVVHYPTTWLLPEERLVTVSATVQWQEKQTLGFVILGLFIGGILGLVGFVTVLVCGIYALATKETKAPLKEITRVCPQCGRVLAEEVKFCPNCGKALESN